MNKLDILEAIAAADAAIEKQPLWGFGPDGFGEYPREKTKPATHPLKPRWTGKPRKGGKQWRKERGLI